MLKFFCFFLKKKNLVKNFYLNFVNKVKCILELKTHEKLSVELFFDITAEGNEI